MRQRIAPAQNALTVITVILFFAWLKLAIYLSGLFSEETMLESTFRARALRSKRGFSDFQFFAWATYNNASVRQTSALWATEFQVVDRHAQIIGKTGVSKEEK